MRDKDVLMLRKETGWRLSRVNGSHHVLEKEGFFPISLPIHGRDVPNGLLNRILKDAGLR